jgi:type II secretory pathway component PulC
MLPWIIQMSIISLILIILVHYLFTFFKTNLTIPKVKDLVNKPQKQYEALFDTMKETITHSSKIENDSVNMKNELKNYLKELSESKNVLVPTSIPTAISTTPNVNNMGGLLTNDSIMGGSFSSNSYSSF